MCVDTNCALSHSEPCVCVCVCLCVWTGICRALSHNETCWGVWNSLSTESQMGGVYLLVWTLHSVTMNRACVCVFVMVQRVH